MQGRRCFLVVFFAERYVDLTYRVEPSHAEPTNGEESVENEEEDSGSDTKTRGCSRSGSGKDSHGSRLSRSTKQHELAATELLNSENCNPRREEVLCSVGSSQDTREEARKANAGLVNRCGVIRDKVNA